MTTTKQVKRLEVLESMRAVDAEPDDSRHKVLEFLYQKAEKLFQSGCDLSHDPDQSPIHNIAAAIARGDHETAKELLAIASKAASGRVDA